jgi:hypothetical protein
MRSNKHIDLMRAAPEGVGSDRTARRLCTSPWTDRERVHVLPEMWR